MRKHLYLLSFFAIFVLLSSTASAYLQVQYGEPDNGEHGVEIQPVCEAYVYDYDGGLMNISFYEMIDNVDCGLTGTWVHVITYTLVPSGEYSFWFENASTYNRSYGWRVDIENDTLSTNRTFCFTTDSYYDLSFCFCSSQFIMLIALAMFIFFFSIGYNTEKRSGGIFETYSGFVLLWFETLIATYVSLPVVIGLMTPIALIIILLGILKFLYHEKEGVTEQY